MFTSTGSGGRRSPAHPFLSLPFPPLFRQLQSLIQEWWCVDPPRSLPPQTHPDRYRKEEAEGKEGLGRRDGEESPLT